MARTSGRKPQKTARRTKASGTPQPTEGLFRALLENSLDATVIVSSDGTILYESQPMENVLGYRPEDRIGRSGFDRIHPDDRADAAALLDQIARNRERSALREYRIQHADGSWRTIQALIQNLLDDPAVGGIAVSIRDITELRQREEEFRESEAKWRTVAEAAAERVVTVDRDGHILFVNRVAPGRTVDEVVGTSVYDYMGPEHEKLVRKALRSVFRSAKIEKYYTSTVTPEGETLWYEANAAPIVRDGEVVAAAILALDVTERRQAQEELQRKEEYFRALIENSQDAVSVLDRNGTHLYASPSYELVLGRNPEGEVGRNALQDVFEEDLPRATEAFNRLLQNPGGTIGEEVRIRREDGSMRTIEVVSRNLLDDPAVQGIVSNFRDITERRQAQEELQQKEAYFRSLIENSQDFIAIVDAQGRIRYQSPLASEVLGYDSAFRGARSALEMIHPDDASEASQVFARLLRTPGSTTNAEVRAWHKDGSWHVFEITGKNLLDDPAVAGIVANFRDITERKEAEALLKESEERYRLLADNATDIIWSTDMDLRYTYISPSVERLRGYTVKEAFALSLEETLTPASLKTGLAAFAENASKAEGDQGDQWRSWTTELEMFCKDGSTVWTETRANFILGPDSRPVGLLGVTRDITERKRVQAELEEYRHSLEQKVEERTAELTEVNEDLKTRIKEQQRAERALKRSERRFRDLANMLPLIVFEMDASGNLTFTNPMGFEASGYSRADFGRGLNAFDMLVPEVHEKARENVKKVLAGEKSTGNEYTFVRKDGSNLPVVIYSSPIIEHGKPAGLRGVIVDVSERRSLELALRKSEERFRTLIEKSSDVIVIVGTDGEIKYESPAVEDVLGYTPEELAGRDAMFGLHPDSQSQVTREFALLLEDPGITVQTEIVYQHKDGSWRDIEATGRNLVDDPAVAGLVINFRDITERKQMEEQLRSEQEYFRSLIENSLEVVAVIDGAGAIRYESPSAARVTGFTLEERRGKSIFEMVHPDDLPGLVEGLKGLLGKPGGVEQAEFRGLWKDGWHHVEGSAQNLLHDPVVEGIVVNFRDITERKLAEAETQRLYEQEKELRERLEAEIKRRMEFTRALAHELKTPLTSVLASSDLLESEITDDTLLGLARNIKQGASKLDDRIDELLDLARGEIGMLQLKTETVDLLPLLREAADRATSRTVERGLSLVQALPPRLPVVEADAARLEQIVTNLLDNAIKFTPHGGRITLRARETEDAITIEVQDTGQGIPKEARERLFEPYQRLESDRENLSGLGLGLSLSKALVELHGGRIWVKSRVGRGSTFGFTLPLRPAQRQGQEPERPGKLWKVLIIEDDHEIVDFVGLNFRLRWPEAALISTGLGEEGVEMVESEAPHVVILDLGLPDISGFEVLRQIRLFSSVPIVVLTVRGDEADMVKGLEWGADDYLVKPFRPSELLARLKVQVRRKLAPEEGAPIVCGPLRLDPTTFQMSHGDKEISLTIVEGRIIEHLMRNAGQVVTHTRLSEAVWGEDYPGAIESLRVYIRYLRQKLETDPSHPKLILTKAGVGYSLAKPT